MEPADPLAQLQDFAARVEALLERNQRRPRRTAACATSRNSWWPSVPLLAKNEQARSRVEAMISRLKS